MIKLKISAEEDEQPNWARYFLNCALANGIREIAKPGMRSILFDEFVAPELAVGDSTVKVKMQENGKFVFCWESEADKEAFILRWSAYDEV
jgi:hypothetical protein